MEEEDWEGNKEHKEPFTDSNDSYHRCFFLYLTKIEKTSVRISDGEKPVMISGELGIQTQVVDKL